MLSIRKILICSYDAVVDKKEQIAKRFWKYKCYFQVVTTGITGITGITHNRCVERGERNITVKPFVHL